MRIITASGRSRKGVIKPHLLSLRIIQRICRGYSFRLLHEAVINLGTESINPSPSEIGHFDSAQCLNFDKIARFDSAQRQDLLILNRY